jgi:hypothetical protein
MPEAGDPALTEPAVRVYENTTHHSGVTGRHDQWYAKKVDSSSTSLTCWQKDEMYFVVSSCDNIVSSIYPTIHWAGVKKE